MSHNWIHTLDCNVQNEMKRKSKAYLSSPGLHHELSCEVFGWCRLQRAQCDSPVQWVTRHNLPVVKHTQAECLTLHTWRKAESALLAYLAALGALAVRLPELPLPAED